MGHVHWCDRWLARVPCFFVLCERYLMFDQFMSVLAALNTNVLWGIPMVVLMIGTGVFLLVVTRGAVFTRFNVVMRYTTKTLFKRADKSELGEGAISPFQAVCTALAATLGTGNIVGVALAVATGGPGAIFWLWLSALAGMVIKFCEVTLSVAYRTRNERGEIVGGPMYYISRGLGTTWLAVLFAIFGFLASFGIGASVQANSLAGSVNATFGIPLPVIGAVVALLAGLVLIGGITRIAQITEKLVPLAAIFYLIGAAAVLVVNAAEIPAAIAHIFRDAFTGTAAVGGFAGATVMYACRVGMSRGVFTHEAGMGSAPIAHASADTDHPARQGLWGTFEVFFDSIVMCTVTGLVIITSGLWSANPQMSEGAMSSLAFEQSIPGGQYIVTVGLMLFAFATLIAWYYYGEKCVEYLFRRVPKAGRVARRVYQVAYVAMVFAGCVASLDTVWELADCFNGLMAIPNLIALIALSPVIKRLAEDFFRDPDRIRPRGTDYRSLLKFRDGE